MCQLLGEGRQRREVEVLGYLFYVSDKGKVPLGEMQYLDERNSADPWFRLRREEILTPERIVEEAFQRRGLSPQIRVWGDSARTSLVLAQSGLGVALAPESMQEPARDWGLESCPISEPSLHSGIALVQNENGCDTAAGRAFWEYFQAISQES